jgi:hypothetical protein
MSGAGYGRLAGGWVAGRSSMIGADAGGDALEPVGSGGAGCGGGSVGRRDVDDEGGAADEGGGAEDDGGGGGE